MAAEGQVEVDNWLTITIEVEPMLEVEDRQVDLDAPAPVPSSRADSSAVPSAEAADAPPRPAQAPPTPSGWHETPADEALAPSPFEVAEVDEAPLTFRRPPVARPADLEDEPTLEIDAPFIPDGSAHYSTDELAVPTALVDEIEAIGAEFERDGVPARVRRPVHLGRSTALRVVEAFGWLVLVAGLVMSGSGLVLAFDGHQQADSAVAEATDELASARAAVGSITGSRSVAAGRIDATAEKVAETEARIGALADELVELEGVVSDLVVLGNRRGMDFEAIMPSLESLGGVLDETVAGLIDLGIGFEPTVSASEAFGILSDRQTEARVAAEQVLQEMTVDEGDGDGFGFDTILLQYPVAVQSKKSVL